jgi:hypothetical protein
MTTSVLVVMESGSDWPGQIGDSTIVVGFGSGDDEELCQRTHEKLEALSRGKQLVRVALLACNASAGGSAADLRARLARMLLRAVTGATCGRLILSVSGQACLRLREELFALAGALSQELRGTTATVSLRFTDGSQGSAMRRFAESPSVQSARPAPVPEPQVELARVVGLP